MFDLKSFNIFRHGSRTYFYSSLFFPSKVRDEIFVLYAFVRKADDFVDQIPQDREGFLNFKQAYDKGIKSKSVQDSVISNFVNLLKYKQLDEAWVLAFLNSMESDLDHCKFNSMDDLEKYIYGSASVIGLMICKILNLPTESYKYASLLGKSMQYANFIRDINEDNSLGRQYLPLSELTKFSLPNLEYPKSAAQLDNFRSFIQQQIKYFDMWQSEAEKGFIYLEKRYYIPIKTASDMYRWTLARIKSNPLIVFEKKVKPSVPRILFTIIKNTLSFSYRRQTYTPRS